MQDLTPSRKPSLAEVQRWMRKVVTQPQGIITALAESPALLPSIENNAPLSREDRLSVYADAYFLRLLECLETDFPATRRAMGRDHFVTLSADFLQKHPSSSPNVSDLGRTLPEFLKTHALTHQFPFVYDLAALEWAVLESLYSDRLPALGPDHLRAIPEAAWPTARFTLDPTVRIFKSDWAIDHLWEKRRQPEENERPLSLRHDRNLLIYRDAEGIQLEVMDSPRARALHCLLNDDSLEEVCIDLARVFPEIDLNVMDWFAGWIRSGVIKQIHFKEIL